MCLCPVLFVLIFSLDRWMESGGDLGRSSYAEKMESFEELILRVFAYTYKAVFNLLRSSRIWLPLLRVEMLTNFRGIVPMLRGVPR